MSNTFQFVVADPSSTLKPGKDPLIRSRCMQGKNKLEGSRRSQREKRRELKKSSAAVFSAKETKSNIPPSLNDFSLVRFACPDISSEAQGLIFKAFAYNVANQALSPLDRCVDFDCLENASFQWLFSDATFLHSILCASYAINDFVLPSWDGQPGKKTVFHLRETLAMLRTKIEGNNVHDDEAVLYVVIQLALLAAVFGDWDAAAAHFAGLHKIIQLRGGLEFLRTRSKLHFKLDRLDLAWSLSSGKKAFFLHDDVSWDPIFSQPSSVSELYQPPLEWNPRLVSVFRDFQHLVLTINRNVQQHARYNATCFQNVLSSLQSRLMHLEHVLEGPIEELVRLSLLAFLTTTFKVPGRRIPYTWIARRLEDSHTSAINSAIDLDKTLHLWCLSVAAISVASSENLWLRRAWDVSVWGMNWQDLKRCITGVMWIECIHDKPGETAYRHLASRKAATGALPESAHD